MTSTNNNNAALFGDSDTSDESVGASKPSKSSDAPAEEPSETPADTNDDDAARAADDGEGDDEKQEDAANKNAALFGDSDSDESVGASRPKKTNAIERESDAQADVNADKEAEKKEGASPSGALFGDDDSSDDDEFDGNDGIVGKSAGDNKAGGWEMQETKVLTMSERLGGSIFYCVCNCCELLLLTCCCCCLILKC